jgi:hypothetical protein
VFDEPQTVSWPLDRVDCAFGWLCLFVYAMCKTAIPLDTVRRVEAACGSLIVFI